MATTDQIKALRELTGVSVMQCKTALEEAGDDMEKAKILLRKKGGAIAAKKSGREFGSGVIEAYVHNTRRVGALVTLLCETDFVAKNDEFIGLARNIAMHVAAAAPQYGSRENVTEKELRSIEEILQKEVADKPKDMRKKILQGKLDAYFKDKVLLEQDFIKDPSMTINDLIESATQKFGERITISHFSRYNV